MMTEYETTMVVRPDIGGDAIEAMLDRVREAVRKKGGKLLAINHWGKKKLSYPIKKQARGVYVHTQYLGKDDLVAELERNLRISDSVLRFLTIAVAKGVDVSSYQEKEYVRPQYELEDASASEEAEVTAEAHAPAHEDEPDAGAGDEEQGEHAGTPEE